jgi:CubicO group peptidase (beta-lactamase class C family)
MKRFRIFILIGTVTGIGFHSTDITQNPPLSSSVKTHIAHIENGLLNRVAIQGESAAPMKLSDRMEHYKVPGVSIAVIDDGKIEWAKGYGILESGKSLPVTRGTLFQAGSISKPVTAAASLRLVQEGKLNLDEDVNKMLVSWKLPSNEFTAKRYVTLRKIMSHSAGITVHGFDGYTVDQPIPTLQQVLDGQPPANSPAIRVDSLPGAEWRYSGGGYTVLQQLLIDVTHETFPTLIHRLVLQPAGMNESTFEEPLPPNFTFRAATGHLRNGTPVQGKWHFFPEMAAAALWSTPSDLCRFAIELQRSFNGKSNRVLSATMTRQMLTPQIDHWGLGLSVEGEGESLHFSHAGATIGYQAFFIAYANKGQGAVVMTNSDQGLKLTDEIIQGIANEYGWLDHNQIVRTRVKVEPAIFQRFAGSYRDPETPELPTLNVQANGSSLLLSDGENTQELLPESATKYFLLDGAEISFVQDSRGAATDLVYQHTDFTIDFKKITQ